MTIVIVVEKELELFGIVSIREFNVFPPQFGGKQWMLSSGWVLFMLHETQLVGALDLYSRGTRFRSQLEEGLS
jgi:hypothetical protein